MCVGGGGGEGEGGRNSSQSTEQRAHNISMGKYMVQMFDSPKKKTAPTSTRRLIERLQRRTAVHL